MQSGYGVSEIQQFMMDGGCPSSLFSISTAPPNAASPSAAAEIHRDSQKFNPLPHPHHHQHHHPHHQSPPHFQHPHQHQHPNPPPHFAHFGNLIPITQQLFQQTHHHHHNHQFQLFHHQQQHLGPDQESGPENSNSPAGGGPSFLAAMNFKAGVNDSAGGGGGGNGFNEDDGILQGDDGSESRMHHSWHREEELAATNIKEPFWRPLDIDYINPDNKRPAKDKQPAEISSNVKRFKKCNEAAPDHIQPSNNNKNANTAATTDSNYQLFSELEAIYNPGGTPTSGGGGRLTGANNQTGSGASALTSDDNPLMPAAASGPAVEHHQPGNVFDTSNGGEAPPQPVTNKFQRKVKGKRSKRARQQKQLASIAAFFESLVKQLMDHQEGLHRKFLEFMERRDRGRTNSEEAWQKQEAAKADREAAARAQERALAAARGAAIISFLEKITGESINMPSKARFTDESLQKGQQHDYVILEPQNALVPYNADSANNNNIGGGGIRLSSNRWPEAEVQALIRVRSGLETRFQEPGLKGPLWEGVSLAMAGLGYQRKAKRCKEKWENINKYFRKAKDSGKKRPQHSKACPYFHQLDHLYSKSLINAAAAAASVTPSSSNANVNEERKENPELLDAIVTSNEAAKWSNAEFNEDEVEGGGEDEGGDHEHEGQGESQEQGPDSEKINRDHGHGRQQLQLCEGKQNAQRDSAHFFHRPRT